MASLCVIKSIYIFEQLLFGVITCLESDFPDHFRFQGFKDGLNGGIETPIFVNKVFVCKCVDKSL